MSPARRFGNFVIPWLAFAALGGLGGALVGGILASVIDLAYGAFTLIGGLTDHHLWSAALSIAHGFPNFAVTVLITAAFFFAVSFGLALLAALVGGGAGIIWGLAALFGSSCFVSSFFPGPHGSLDTFLFIPVFVVAGVGMVVPAQLLGWDEPRYLWDGPIRRWLRSTWLLHPPQLARSSAIVLPIPFCLYFDIHTTLPIYLANQNYAPRLGTWETWRNSTNVARRDFQARSFSCQSNLKQIMLGVLQYQEDYDGYYPPKPASAASGPAAVLQPYVKSTRLFQCPSEFYMPDSVDPANPDFTDYWFNARLFDRKTTNLSGTSATVTFGDGNTGVGEANAAYSLGSLPANFRPLLRHRSGSNYAFADGHVRWLVPGLVSNTLKSSFGSPTMNP